MDPYQPSNLDDLRHPLELRHAGFGVASFVLACLSLAGMFATFAIAGYLGAQRPDIVQTNSGVMVVIGMAIMGFAGLLLLAAVLGIVGLCQSNRKKVFAILGLVLSGLVIAGAGSLIAIGLVMGQSQMQKM